MDREPGLLVRGHARGLAVVLDVVYNHLGPEGNYLGEFAPYFTNKHNTPWGDALDFSLPQVRRYFVENAAYWVREYHMDGLRLDAVHTAARKFKLQIADLPERLQRGISVAENGRLNGQ